MKKIKKTIEEIVIKYFFSNSYAVFILIVQVKLGKPIKRNICFITKHYYSMHTA